MAIIGKPTDGFQSAEVSAIDFKAAIVIMENWGCQDDDMMNILCIDRVAFSKCKLVKVPFSLGKEQQARIGYVLNIHESLRSTFSNPENVAGFMTMVNNSPYFKGRTPLDVIKSADISALKEVCSRLMVWGAGNF